MTCPHCNDTGECPACKGWGISGDGQTRVAGGWLPTGTICEECHGRTYCNCEAGWKRAGKDLAKLREQVKVLRADIQRLEEENRCIKKAVYHAVDVVFTQHRADFRGT